MFKASTLIGAAAVAMMVSAPMAEAHDHGDGAAIGLGILGAAAVLGTAAALSAPAQPVYAPPPTVVYAAPPAVVYAPPPAPVYYAPAPAPVYYAQPRAYYAPAPVYYGYRRW